MLQMAPRTAVDACIVNETRDRALGSDGPAMLDVHDCDGIEI